MCVIRWFLLKSCIFGMYISVTGASVLLETFDRKTTYLKGSNVTLVCTITPYNNVMTWYVDNDNYAGCFLGTCAPSANKPYTFSFDFDETTGVFKLTIDPVDSSHAELSFVCDDGTVTKTISFTVTTVTNEGNEDNDDSELSEGEIVGIVLGCFFGTAFICTVVILPVYLRHRRKEEEKRAQEAEQRRRAIQAQVAAQHQAELEDQRAAAAAAAAAQHQAQQAEQRRKEKLKEIIEDLKLEPKDCCIIMQELLESELSGQIMEEIREVLHAMEQRKKVILIEMIQEKERARHDIMGKRVLEGIVTDAKMKELVKNTTFSSFVMQVFKEKKQALYDDMISLFKEKKQAYYDDMISRSKKANRLVNAWEGLIKM